MVYHSVSYCPTISYNNPESCVKQLYTIPLVLRTSPLVKRGTTRPGVFSPLNKGGYGEAEGGSNQHMNT